MLQPLFGRATASVSSGTQYASLTPTGWTATLNDATQYIGTPGTIGNVRFEFNAGPGVGTSYTFTLQVNGVDSALTLTLSDTNTVVTNSTTFVHVSAGDRVHWKSVSTGATGASILQRGYVEFNSDNDRSCTYAAANQTINSVSPAWFGVFNGVARITSAAVDAQSVIAIDGTITNMYVWVNGSGTTGTGYDFYVYKNGVKQDGTGGTVDTHVFVASTTNGLLAANASFSLPVSAGDLLYVEYARSGSASAKVGGVSLTVVVTRSNEIHIGGRYATMSTGTSNEFNGMGDFTSIGNSASELLSNNYIRKLQLQNLYVKLTAAPSAGKSRTFTVRKGGNDTSLACTVADTATIANDTSHKVKYAVGDTLGIREAAASTTTTAAIGSYGVLVSVDNDRGAAGGNSNNGKKGGGGGLSILNPGGASYVQIGNPGVDVGITS